MTPTEQLLNGVTDPMTISRRGKYVSSKFHKGHLKSAKLSASQVAAIRESYANGATQGQLAREYGMSVGQIGRIVRRENWTQFAGPLHPNQMPDGKPPDFMQPGWTPSPEDAPSLEVLEAMNRARDLEIQQKELEKFLALSSTESKDAVADYLTARPAEFKSAAIPAASSEAHHDNATDREDAEAKSAEDPTK
jgi:hypothetical protein